VAVTGGMTMEIRAGGLDGRKLGKISLSPSQASGSYQTVSGKLKPLKGEHDIFIHFLGKKGATAQLDWFRFGGEQESGGIECSWCILSTFHPKEKDILTT